MPIPGIQSIRNVMVFHSFQNTPGTFSATFNDLPSTHADEVVIRSITWNGDPTVAVLFLLWSNLNSDIIGSFSGSTISTYSPGTRIILNGIVPNQLQFRLMIPQMAGADNAPPVMDNSVAGDIGIHMDFITYQR